MLHADGLPSLVNLSLNHDVEPTGVCLMDEDELRMRLRVPDDKRKLTDLKFKSVVRWLMFVSKKDGKTVPLAATCYKKGKFSRTTVTIVEEVIDTAEQNLEIKPMFSVDLAARHAVKMMTSGLSLRQVLEKENPVQDIDDSDEEPELAPRNAVVDDDEPELLPRNAVVEDDDDVERVDAKV